MWRVMLGNVSRTCAHAPIGPHKERLLAIRLASSLAIGHTLLRLKDVRRSDRGSARRLTFEERAERRAGKSREQRAAKENLLQEAETVINTDVPDELQLVFQQHLDRANVSAMKVLNMAKCLELLEVDVGGQKVLLTKAAQVLKTGATTLEIVPRNTTFSSSILQRVTRFDAALHVAKEQQKIKVSIPTVTTSRREKAVEEIQQTISSFRNKAKQLRSQASRALQEAGIEDAAARELHQQLDETINSFVDEKVVELEQLAADVTSMGVDEADLA
ncbi:hypothetical protein TRVL_07409 [Trypanosoma vivax]|uniref:Ribosome recycling factor domain-containing protein n=1 Tax=Trypanosoma vivax (strain Y486) TaxID=1055687 RepID=G0TWK2_TRYVY|nr:hypothetical protein TRVL_07409 [Trypanosoma vivax]CCC48340.1 conserved hypothetical protein [Trypanosoma vivax Y486]